MRGLRTLLLLLPLLLAAPVRGAHRDTPPVLPGLHGDHPLDERLVGQLLIGELRCTACHDEIPAGSVPIAAGPDLSEVGWRVDPEYLVRFIADPAGTRPGTKMPAMLGAEPTERRAEIAAAITHFLVAEASRRRSPEALRESEIAAGEDLFHSVGCVACHAPRVPALEGTAVPEPGRGAVDLGHVAAKYGVSGLAAFLFRPLRRRPSGRMPDMGLNRAEARSIASYLIGTSRRSHASLLPRPERVVTGRRHFQDFGCTACHDLDGLSAARPAAPAGRLDPTRGCLSPADVDTPRYPLDDAQRAAIVKALESSPDLSDRERIDSTLTAFNCIACHVRGDYGGVPRPLDPYFGTSEPDLGDEARIPPQLTLTGAKLQGEWLRKVLFDSGHVRPYMFTRMPQFGEPNLAHLPALFEREDEVEPFEMPIPTGEEARIARDAGRELLGITGLSCISCHDFNGRPSPNFGGVDLINSCERLRPGWFARFLIEPQVYRPGIVMPESWSGGVAAHTGILDGDTEAQIRAIWYLLSQGRTAGDPRGIHPVPTNLEVTDTVRTYRGRSRIAGFRGIAVGHPGGLNFAFDAQTGTLSGLWLGDFVSVRWDGQGAGDFNPRARPIELGRDVSFHRLPDADAPWPLRPRTDKENPVNPDPLYPRNHGYRFGGYSFDEDLVPTFLYRSGDVSIEDRSEADTSGEHAILRRTLRLSAPVAETLHFRALTGAVEVLSERELATPRLKLRIPEVPTLLRQLEGEEPQTELLLELSIPAGSSTVVIEYEVLP